MTNLKLFTRTIIAFLFLCFSNVVFAQQQTDSNEKDFKITIQKTRKGLKLSSEIGSAWSNLSFSLKDYSPMAIDENGMAKSDKISTEKNAEHADYLFTITKTLDGVKLTGMKGTAWEELSFKLSKNGKKTINQLGLIE